MRILIIGAGISGLSLAAHLQKTLHIQPTVVEQCREWKTSGFVIGLWPNGSGTLKDFDVYHELSKVSVKPEHLYIRDRKGEIIKDLPFQEIVEKHGPLLAVRRTTFHEYLLSLNKEIDIRMGTTVSKMFYDKTGDVMRVTFSDESEAEFDLVVGADGIHSPARDYVSPGDIEHSSGITGFLMMANLPGLEADHISEIWDEDEFFGMYPCTDGDFHLIFACPSDKYENRQENTTAQFLKNTFNNMEWLSKEIFPKIADDKTVFADEWKIVRTENWHKDRVVLMGDAAHAMVPSLGMGANMALEDSYVLAHELAAAGSVDLAVKNYVAKRKERVHYIFDESLEITRLIKTRGALSQEIRNIMLHLLPVSLIENNFEHILAHDVTQDYA